ncbi:MAG: hypothetical protein Barrevirus43_4 [Barrevirus sp.]|uniref:Uncharacterized protein n=1 Tax=Barrevirus sp. TaxID=2487763 RepID=A0A3G4ZTN1_9VIRU|nr:MAG: hypothetical protein Barrevirus43_4 [Barrevirus sp.]
MVRTDIIECFALGLSFGAITLHFHNDFTSYRNLMKLYRLENIHDATDKEKEELEKAFTKLINYKRNCDTYWFYTVRNLPPTIDFSLLPKKNKD